MADPVTIGLISDTHGLLRPEALAALKGSDLILHAGDVGDPRIVEELRRLAPVVVVRGNVDKGPWAEAIPLTEVVEIGDHCLYMLHDLEELDLDPRAAGFAAVVHGHTHRPENRERRGVLYLNPGSAGPRRPGLPVTVARLGLEGGSLDWEIQELEV